jgi:hypothetical protein
MIGGVPWRPWDNPVFRYTLDEPGETLSSRMPLHPGVLRYRHDLFMVERRTRRQIGMQELHAWFDAEMRARGQL